MSDAGITLSRGERTRKELLDLAEVAILEKGFAATSIDELIAQAGITKSGFFYHFEDKLDLAKELLRRDNVVVEAALMQIFEAADALHSDPLDAVLEAMAQYARAAAASPASRPGCLAAALSYQHALLDDEVRELVRRGFEFKRCLIRGRLERVAAKHPPSRPVDFNALADMAVALLHGAMVLDRVRDGRPAMLEQMDLYCIYLQAVFGRRAA